MLPCYVIFQLVSSVAQSCLILCNPMDCNTPGFPVHHQLPEPAQTHIHQVSDAIQPSPPLLSPSPPAFSLSQLQGLFTWVSSSIRWPKYWNFSFSFSFSPSNEYSGPISFRIDWLDLLAVQDSQECSPTATAAAAKWLQSCLTLCNPLDGSLPGSPIPGILQARTLE